MARPSAPRKVASGALTFSRVVAALLALFSMWFLSGLIEVQSLSEALFLVDKSQLLLALTAYTGSLFCRHLRWWALLLPTKRLTVRSTFSICGVALLASEVVPIKPITELVRPVLLWEREQVPIGTGLGAAALERMLDAFVLSGLLLLVLGWAPIDLTILPLASGWNVDLLDIVRQLVAFGMVGAIGCCLLLLGRGEGGVSRLERVLASVFPGGAQRVAAVLGHFSAGLSAIAGLRTASVLVVSSLFLWGLNVLSICWFAGAFGAVLSLPAAGLVLVALVVGMMAPAPPAYAGVFELAVTAGLTLSGVAAPLAATIALSFHACHLFLAALFGLPFLVMDGVWLGPLRSRVLAESERMSAMAKPMGAEVEDRG